MFENNKSIYDFITKTHEEVVIKELENSKDELINIFDQLLKEHGAEYKLQTQSSVNHVFYFAVKGRIKTKKSFAEKLIRKDLGIEFIKDFGENLKEYNSKRALIVNRIKKLDDIVGIRIVTELKEDTYSVIKLLNDNLEFLKSQNIVLHNISSQPEKMKNGLDIFRIKAEYQDIISFELQVKSKIEEAWGEMDHTIFYKDHSFSPIKPTVQKTMNNISLLLDRIENLLFDLRHSSQEFEMSRSFINFENNLYKRYNAKITEVFGHSISINEISEPLFLMRNDVLKTQKNIIDLSFNFDFLKLPLKEEKNLNLSKLFHTSHKLLITEALFHNILRTDDNSFSLDINNYEEIFELYLNLYFNYLSSKTGIEVESFRDSLTENALYFTTSSVLFDYKKIRFYEKVSLILTNSLEDQPEEDIQLLRSLCLIELFEGRTLDYWLEVKEQLESNVMQLIETVEKELQDYPEDSFRDSFSKVIYSLKRNVNEN